MAVEVLPSPVVDGGRAGIGVAVEVLHVAQRDARIETAMMNAAEHVRENGTRSRALADGADPAVSGASVEALSVAAAKDRPIATFPDSQVDRASSPRDEGDRRRPVALAHDAQRAVAAFEAEIPRCWWRTFAHSQSVRPEQHGKRGRGRGRTARQ